MTVDSPKLQKGQLSSWVGDNSVNVQVGEIRLVFPKAAAVWLHFRLGEMLKEMPPGNGPPRYEVEVIGAAQSVEKARQP